MIDLDEVAGVKLHRGTDMAGRGYIWNPFNMEFSWEDEPSPNLYTGRPIKVSYLPYVTRDSYTFHICTTNRCNLGCSYCFRDRESPPGLDFERDRRIVDAIFERVPAEKIYIIQLGVTGEVFAQPDEFWKLYDHVLSKGIPFWSVAFVTNGTLLRDEDIRRLKGHRFATVSIDGPKEIHDSHRRTLGGGGTWDRTSGAIKRMRAEGISISTVSVVTAEEDTPLWDIVDCVYSLGANSTISLSPIKRKGYWTADRLGRLLERYRDFYAELERRVCSGETHWLANLHTGLTQIHGKSCGMYCGAEKPNFLAVDHRGDLYKCEYHMGGGRLGNIFETDLEKLYWEMYPKFLDSGRIPDGCVGCEWSTLCGGWRTFCQFEDVPMRCGINKIQRPAEISIYSYLKGKYEGDELEFMIASTDSRQDMIRRHPEDRERWCSLDSEWTAITSL